MVLAIFIFQSLSHVNIPAAIIDTNSSKTFLLPLSLTLRVSAAACPIAKGNSFVTIKYFLNKAVKINPRITPPKVTVNKAPRLTSVSGLSIHMPGIVNASPPATIAPADMAV